MGTLTEFLSGLKRLESDLIRIKHSKGAGTDKQTAAALKRGLSSSFYMRFFLGNYSRVMHSLNTNQHSWGHKKSLNNSKGRN